MMLTLILLVALSSSTAYARSRIVNGQEAQKREFPYQVSLQTESCIWIYCSISHNCGASVIDRRWVVTAAHCVDTADASKIRLVINEHDLSTGEGDEDTYFVDKIILHEDWKNGVGAFPNDIAVMRVTRDIPVKNIIEMAAPDDVFDGDWCTISGWGAMQGGGSVADILQKTSGQILSNQDCSAEDKWPGSINDGHICIHDKDSGACNGDSGGPLVCGEGSARKLVGVTSWGRSGCITSYPSVYSRVSYFHDWLIKTMNAN